MEGKENLDMEAKESRAGVAIHILLVFIAGIYPLLRSEEHTSELQSPS